MHDFKSEIDMYLANEHILDHIDGIEYGGLVSTLLLNIYQKLVDHNIVKSQELDILKLWLSYF